MSTAGTHAASPAGPLRRGSAGGVVPIVRRLTHSLAGKLFAVLFLILLLNLGVLGYVNVRLHREHLEAAAITAAEQMSDVVRRSTSYNMLRNDREALSHIVETIGKEPGIEGLRIMNASGRVGFSTVDAEIGGIVTPHTAGVPYQQSRILNGPTSRLVAISTPIHNSPACSTGACHAHPESERVLGTLDINVSLADVDADVRKASRQFIAHSAVVILLTLATTGVLVLYLIHEPVRLLRKGTIRIGRGDLTAQVPVRSQDELGELAASFNEMSRQLRTAREETNAWAHTLEDRVQSKTVELQRAHQQMMQAEKLSSLGKLAAVVAHEINNPLSGILTYAKLLRKWIERGDSLYERAPDMRDSLQLIENESRRCGDIVRNLLTFARVQPLNISDVDVNRIVHTTVKLVEHKLELGNIVTRLDLDPDLPRIRGDAAQIEQLLLALVMNGIEAMPHEGNLRIATSSPDGDSVVIRVEDDGTGMPAEILSHLFEPFVTTKEEKGVGLGLAISRAIVDRHSGHISVHSEPGRGTSFTITLPSGAPGGSAEMAPPAVPHPEVA